MPPAFQPFDIRGSFRSTHRNLPNWHQAGVVYFVTFRLADSLPAGVRARFEEMRRLNDNEAFVWVERFLDAGCGRCLLQQAPHAARMASVLRHFDQERYALGAFAVMPNHVHALVQPLGTTTLTRILHGWKSYGAHQLQSSAGIKGRVWQEESFDRIVRDETELRRFHDYILANPSAANLQPEACLVSQGSAQWLKASA